MKTFRRRWRIVLFQERNLASGPDFIAVTGLEVSKKSTARSVARLMLADNYSVAEVVSLGSEGESDVFYSSQETADNFRSWRTRSVVQDRIQSSNVSTIGATV